MRPKLTPPLAHPVVVDLLGLDVGAPNLPALKDHNPQAVVGYPTSVARDGLRSALAVEDDRPRPPAAPPRSARPAAGAPPPPASCPPPARPPRRSSRTAGGGSAGRRRSAP